MFHCYKITCHVTGKAYVGITGRTIDARYKQHLANSRKGSLLIIHCAMRKYGAENFSVETLAECANADEAKLMEVDLIAMHQTKSPQGYNMTAGGDGCVSLCDESIKKKSTKAKLLHQNIDFKHKHREGIVRSMTPQRRQRISEIHTGKTMHPNAKAAILLAKKTPECRMVASQAAAATWSQDGYKEKWVEAKRKKHLEKAKRFPIRSDGLIFASTRAASGYMRINGFPTAAPNNICLACNKKTFSSYGFSWGWIDGDAARKLGSIIA